MAKDKFRKRKDLRRNIRGEMTKRGIVGREIAAKLNITPGAVSKGCATSPRIIAALIEAGVPARMFGKDRGQGSGVRGQGSEDRGQGSGVRGQEGER